MKTFTLNDGNEIPAIGFGTYDPQQKGGITAIDTALQEGYRLIDGAAKYGNEVQVGEAIKKSGVARKEIFLTTKVWREELGYESTRSAFRQSAMDLQVDYIDLYLIHWPANAKNYTHWQQANADTWRAMEDLQKEGKIRSIGVSNFWPEHLEALMKTARVKPAVNQIEFHPGYWQPEVAAFCQNHEIRMEAWSPLARGKIFDNDLLKSIAEKHHKSVSQIVLRWIHEHGVIPIPKASSKNRIKDNLHIFDFTLTTQEIEEIDQLPEMGFSGELPNNWPERIPQN